MFPGEIDVQPSTYLDHLGTIFARFGAATQDSGNISYGVQTADRRYFVKTAGDPAATAPYLDFTSRVALLRNAAVLQEATTTRYPSYAAFHEAWLTAQPPRALYGRQTVS